MAVYAAVVSLMNTIEQIQNHPRLSTSFDRTQMKSLQEKAAFLLDFIERDDSHGGMNKEEEGLESLIASAAHEAEDVIEFHIAHQILECSNTLLDLQQVIKNVDFIKEKVKEKWVFKEEQCKYSTITTLSRAVDTGKSSVVEFEDDVLTRLMEMLVGHSSSRQVISIVGMGGIGKTTLARNAYESSLIVQYFDIRAWAIISQEYDEYRVLKELLSCLKKSTAGAVDELEERLYKELWGRRYLIMLDDIWSVEVWNKLKVYFPDNGNGSRIVMTTRLSNLSISFGYSSFEMKFLDDNKSWNLLREKAFGQEDCPPKLVKIGKKIAEQCKGLPLSIVVIGGLLRKSNMKEEYWKKVAENISLILRSREDEQCMKVLSLSYSELPPRLKPCFLYMGVFKEDREIRASQLINLWVGEGFLKPNNIQSLEEVAECCLKDLIERNLILVRRSELNRKVKTCGIHDLLRELCLSIAKKEKFFQDMRVPEVQQGIVKECRRVVNDVGWPSLAVYDAPQSSLLVRSLIYDGDRLPLTFQLPFTFPLLRVVSNVTQCPLEDSFGQVNLRYLNHHCSGSFIYKLPTSISLLRNLQTLIINGNVLSAPSEIWEMRQLRHLKSEFHIYLPGPPHSGKDDGSVLQNLLTLVNVLNFRLTEDVRKRILNIKKLRLRYQEFSEHYCLKNLGRLHKLQSLNLCISEEPRRHDLGQRLAFPSSLRKLSLTGCGLCWEDLTGIGFSSPHLEVLVLEHNSVVGPKWDLDEGAFPRLKFLKISRLDLVYWVADSSHFPVLEELFLCGLDKLDEIPLDIAEIPTLECIRLEDCSSSASISSTKILEEQLSLGNEDFRVQVLIRNPADGYVFRRNVDIKSFAHNNFEYEDRMVANGSLSRRESMKSDKETNFHISHAIMSIQSEDGDIIDCIDIYKQPAFAHPALRDHKIQMVPSYSVKPETAADPGTITGQIWRRSGSCPKGTIPVRRIRNNNSNHVKKQAISFSQTKQFNDSKMLLLLQKNHSIAVLHTEGFAYLGAKGDIKVFNPRVESDDEYSTSQVALKNGYETMESGWAVNPSLYGDRQTRLFVYWTADGSNKTGCFDLTCPGFVQTSNEFALGAAIYPISNPPRGLPYEITIFIHKDPNMSNWWLLYGDRTNIGYWPPGLFDSLSYHAELVQWGGEVYSSRVGTRPHTSTAMGSGEFPDFIFQTSGSVKRIRVLENSLVLRFPRWVNGYTDEYDCYQTYYLGDYVYEPEFYYGGPGSYRNPMCR